MKLAFLGAMLFCSTAFALAPRDIYQRSGAAVVLILSSDDGKTGSGGTGSIISKDGLIITNGHVVLNASGSPYKTTYVYLKPAKITGDNSVDLSQRYTAKVKAYSPPNALDLAVLQLEDAPSGLPVVQFGDPDDVNIGDPVVAVGHPEQGGLWTLTTGTISTVLQNFDRIKGKHVFQTEASFNRGNSGGPLFDENGNMVGINTMIARKAADGLAITAVNFSLKSSVAVTWLKEQNVSLAYAPRGQTGQALAQVTPPAGKGAAAAGGEPAPMAEAKTPEAASAKGKAVATQPTPVQQGTAQQATAQQAKEVPQGAKIQTDKRPYSLDNLLKDQMKEMDDLMGEMRGSTQRKLKGR